MMQLTVARQSAEPVSPVPVRSPHSREPLSGLVVASRAQLADETGVASVRPIGPRRRGIALRDVILDERGFRRRANASGAALALHAIGLAGGRARGERGRLSVRAGVNRRVRVNLASIVRVGDAAVHRSAAVDRLPLSRGPLSTGPLLSTGSPLSGAPVSVAVPESSATPVSSPITVESCAAESTLPVLVSAASSPVVASSVVPESSLTAELSPTSLHAVMKKGRRETRDRERLDRAFFGSTIPHHGEPPAASRREAPELGGILEDVIQRRPAISGVVLRGDGFAA